MTQRFVPVRGSGAWRYSLDHRRDGEAGAAPRLFLHENVQEEARLTVALAARPELQHRKHSLERGNRCWTLSKENLALQKILLQE